MDAAAGARDREAMVEEAASAKMRGSYTAASTAATIAICADSPSPADAPRSPF
jgi:hypothetical protein